MAMSNRVSTRCPLTPDTLDEAVLRMKRSNNTYFRKYVDFQIWDEIQWLLDAPQYSEVLETLRTAVKSEKTTKFFKNATVTMEQAHHFTPDRHIPSIEWMRSFRLASSLVEQLLCVQTLRPLRFQNSEELLNSLSNKSASAGAIGVGSKRDNIRQAFDLFTSLKEEIAEGGNPQIPALSFHRSQISNYVVDGVFSDDNIKYKDRLVWGLDAATVAVEMQYAIPLVNHMSRNVGWYAGGKSPAQLRHAINRARLRSHYWVSLDFSMFDQTVPDWLIRHAFFLVSKFFTGESKAELDWIRDNFIHTKIILYDGSVFEKHRGIPSGSQFTQAIGSICNALVIWTYLCSLETSSNPKVELDYVARKYGDFIYPSESGMFIMGDDNLIFTQVPIDVVDLSQYVKKNFGMVIHPDKTEGDRSLFSRPKFLKREWRSSNGEYRDLAELLINVVHPERERKYDTYKPIHILYGLFLTYVEAFGNYNLEGRILDRMRVHNNVQELRHLNPNDLPGSLRILGDRAGDILYRRAKAFGVV